MILPVSCCRGEERAEKEGEGEKGEGWKGGEEEEAGGGEEDEMRGRLSQQQQQLERDRQTLRGGAVLISMLAHELLIAPAADRSYVARFPCCKPVQLHLESLRSMLPREERSLGRRNQFREGLQVTPAAPALPLAPGQPRTSEEVGEPGSGPKYSPRPR